jgi:hypothetical protein
VSLKRPTDRAGTTISRRLTVKILETKVAHGEEVKVSEI